jgi:hypothetical protein
METSFIAMQAGRSGGRYSSRFQLERPDEAFIRAPGRRTENL